MKIAQVRKEIDQIPIVDRRWILLQLAKYECDEYGQSYLVGNDELSRLCHDIGAATLRSTIKYLARPAAAPRDPDVPDDPDLDLGPLCWFIYDHAKDLLSERDAGDVLAAGNVIAAAELRPAEASKWLREEVLRKSGQFQGWERARLLASLWRICGPADAEFIVDHYFEDPPDPGSFPTERTAFLEAASEHPRTEFHGLVIRIIRDPRLDKTGPDSTSALLRIVSHWAGNSIVSEEDLQTARGHEELDEQNFKPLASWHNKLRASIRSKSESFIRVGIFVGIAVLSVTCVAVLFRRLRSNR